MKLLEFTSDRKMMTRVVQNIMTGQIFAFSKGADSSVIPLCGERDQCVFDSLEEFGNLGYRTLAFA